MFSKNIRKYGSLLFLLVSVACGEKLPKRGTMNENFDAEEIVNVALQKQGADNCTVTKISTFNQKTDTVELQQVDLKKELAPFDAIYINKPALKGLFLARTINKSSYYATHFMKVKGSNTNVLYVSAFFTYTHKLFKIESEVKKGNKLFNSQQTYTLVFDSTSAQPFSLLSYSVEGNEGFFIGGRDVFKVVGKIKPSGGSPAVQTNN